MKKPRPTPRHKHTPPPPARLQPPAKPTHWAEVADWYDTLVGDEGSEYHREVLVPGILRLLDSKNKPAPLQIMDLACGQGVLSRKLAALGHQLTAVDAAQPLIDAGARRNAQDRLPIRYLTADATKLLDDNGAPIAALKAASFDAITLILAIQNITPLSPVWKACHTLLRPGGSLIIVMMHPCFRVPQHSGWYWNEPAYTQERTVSQYLTSTTVQIETHPGKAAHGNASPATPHFHRPLQAYVNTLANAGLLIDHLDEWISHKTSQAGPKKEPLDRARKEFPLFLAVRARRV